jgi:hypothetical protein
VWSIGGSTSKSNSFVSACLQNLCVHGRSTQFLRPECVPGFTQEYGWSPNSIQPWYRGPDGLLFAMEKVITTTRLIALIL